MSIARPYTPRVNAGGNFCGHNPLAPKLTLPVSSTLKQRPRVLQKLQQEMQQYFSNPARLPSLNAANRSSRQQRSERREACLLALAAILEFTDLSSLRCGIPSAQGFVSLTIDYLAKLTGMGLRRMERAVADLKTANAVTFSQPRQMREDGSFKGLAAIKAVNKQLFTAFGLAEWLKHERNRASVRLRKKAKKAGGTLTQWGRNALVISGNGQKRSSSSAGRSAQQERAARSDEFLKARAALLIAIKLERPGWTSEQVHQEADRLLNERFSA